jgi:hypothetical protein
LTQLLAVIALFPAARIVTHASERERHRAQACSSCCSRPRRVGPPATAGSRGRPSLTLAVGVAWPSGLAPRPGRGDHVAQRAATLPRWDSRSRSRGDRRMDQSRTLIGRAILAGAIAALYVYAATLALAPSSRTRWPRAPPGGATCSGAMPRSCSGARSAWCAGSAWVSGSTW